jgi:hypothetical protein
MTFFLSYGNGQIVVAHWLAFGSATFKELMGFGDGHPTAGPRNTVEYLPCFAFIDF